MKNKLCVCWTSASRPYYFKESYKSFVREIGLYDNHVHCLHEDCCNEKLSKKLIGFVKTPQYEFDHIMWSNPRIGLIGSVMNMLNIAETYRCNYVFRICDDFIFTDYVDIPNLIDIMDKNVNINQIIFNKRPNNKSKGKFVKKEIDFGGQKLTVTPRWSSINSIWRVDFMYQYFLDCWCKIKGTKKQFAPWKEFEDLLSEKFNVNMETIDADWVIENLGCYLYGGIGDDGSYVNLHIGGGKSRVFVGK
jgi:hypothetical protein